MARRPDRTAKRIAGFLKDNGAVPAIQLGHHAGRKASMQRPWFGNAVLDEADRARGDCHGDRGAERDFAWTRAG